MEENKVSFLKKKEGKSFDKERRDEVLKSQPVWDSKRKIVFVNGSKYRRAEEILALIRGEKAPQKQEDEDRRAHYEKHLAANEIPIDSPDAVAALYELLGGLIRTTAQQKEANEKAKEMKAKGKKKMIE